MLLAAVGAAGSVLLTTDDESNKGNVFPGWKKQYKKQVKANFSAEEVMKTIYRTFKERTCDIIQAREDKIMID